MKVYVISYYQLYSDNSYASGTSYVFDTYEKAANMLEQIKIDEANDFGVDPEDVDLYKNDEGKTTGFLLECGCEYVKYVITEMEVK